jgi:hypothetical protein
MTKNITVKIYDLDTDREKPPSGLIDYIAWLNKKLTQVPDEYRATARTKIEATTSYDSGELVYEIAYTRPETAEETKYREGCEAACAERIRQQELRTLAALQAKYVLANDLAHGAAGGEKPTQTY